MTSNKVVKSKMSLLGSNVLRGGKHVYSADVLGENWFDRRLDPSFIPRQSLPTHVHAHLKKKPTDQEEIALFNRYGRTKPTYLGAIGTFTNTINSWNPPEPFKGHPPVDDHFNTISDLSYGIPEIKNRPILVGRNLLSHPFEDHRITTEHREQFINPRLHALHSKDTQNITHDKQQAADCLPEIKQISNDSQCHPHVDNSSGSPCHEQTESEPSPNKSNNRYDTHNQKPVNGSNPIFGRHEAERANWSIPSSRLVSTSLIGVPPEYLNPPSNQAYMPLQ